MRFAIELDFLNRFRRNKKNDQEKRHGVNVTFPFLGVFGRNTKSGIGVTEEGALGPSAVYAAISKIATTLARVEAKLDHHSDTIREHDQDIEGLVGQPLTQSGVTEAAFFSWRTQRGECPHRTLGRG